MNNPINSTSFFDSRDLIEYRDFLADEILSDWNEWQEENLNDEFEAEDAEQAIQFAENLKSNGSQDFLVDYSGEISEYKAIQDFCHELDYGDFPHGQTIISEHYFTEYCEELLKDCGYLPSDIPSWIEIDFDKTADNMSEDYIKADFEGTTYLMRA